MKFDKTKILTVVTADQLKEGQLGWIEDAVDCLKSAIQHITPYNVFRTKEDIVNFPFIAKGRGIQRYFYPAPTHAERQAEWVKENGVKEGTRIRITKDFGEDSDARTKGHTGVAGRCGRVSFVGNSYINIHVDSEAFYFLTVPYYAMEVIKDPTYRPFNNDELNDLVGEILTNKQSGRRKLVTGKPTASEGVNLDGSYIAAKDLLSSFYRNTNEPCGIKE